MTDTSEQEYPDAARARIVLAAAAREVADDARGMVQTRGESGPTGSTAQGDAAIRLIEQARALRLDADDLVRLAVIHAREHSISWEAIGEALTVTRQTAHQRYAPAVERWHDALYDPALHTPDDLPEGAYAPGKVAGQLDAWLDLDRAQYEPEQGTSAGLPRYDPLRRTTETLNRLHWRADRHIAGTAISAESSADHKRRTAALTTETARARHDETTSGGTR